MVYYLFVMNGKIAYLKSSKLSASPINEFCNLAKSFGVDFAVENFDADALTSEDLSKLSLFDAIVVSSSANLNSSFLNAVATRLNLYAKCVFKNTDFSNLSGSNLAIVSDVVAFENGGFGTSQEFGRQAFDTLRYSELEIERTARIAFELAEKRAHALTLADAMQTRNTTALWRKIVSDINEDYSSVHLELESIFDVTKALAARKEFDVILTSYSQFDALSGVADAFSPLGDGTSTVAYLGETTVGLYATERPAVYAPLFDMLALSKMLEHSFDLPELLKAWQSKIKDFA